ncbi:MAG TPA: enoyl-CoA hydratase/isomerase family protein [Bryobacteraceae bacterium]|nr:enoyl-CoA hydratase/isomerase family protein [Bryobacteraceae bacterium]
MSDYRKITYSVEQGIARVTLNRPEKRNALDGELVSDLACALEQSAEDQAVRVVVLAGAGPDFCSGADLDAIRRIAEAGVMENAADARHLGDVFLAMRRHPRPVVAAVRGRALAGGCGVATGADIILAAESAQFGYPEIRIGFVPAMVMAILRRAVSEKRAFELLATGEIISARTALEIGMITRVFADDVFERETEAYVTQLAGRSASALALTKSLFHQTDAAAFEAALAAGVQTNALARLTEDCKRGIEEFLKKTR